MLRYNAEEHGEADIGDAQRVKNLYSAVMFRAVHDLTLKRKEGGDPLERISALAWFNGAPGVITFKECCHVLDYKAEAVLLALRGKGLLPSENPLKLVG